MTAKIRKIYLDTGEATLKHGAIDNLDIGAMAMTLTVKDKVSPQHFKEGQTVWTVFDTADGQPTVVDLRSE